MSRPARIIDLHVSDLADAHRLVDERRHGRPLVLHDPEGVLELRHDDEHAMERARRDAVGGGPPPGRAVAGQPRDRPRRPRRGARVPRRLRRQPAGPPVARHAFGSRYLRTDLPEGYADRVAGLLAVGDLQELQARADAAFAWQDELLAELGR